MATRDLSNAGLRDLAEANETAIGAISPGPSRAIFQVTNGAALDAGETLTVSIDEVVVATLTTISDAGGATARTGANAADVDLGGNAFLEGAKSIPEFGFAMGLLMEAGDIDPVDIEVYPAAFFDGPSGVSTGFALVFKCYTGAISLETTIANTSVSNPA